MTLSYRDYGIHLNADNSISCQEWCPGVDGISLVGDFSKFVVFFSLLYHCFSDKWNTSSHAYEKQAFGQWSLKIPANPDGTALLKNGDIYKLAVKKNGHDYFKLSPWTTYVEKATTNIYEMVSFPIVLPLTTVLGF